MIFIAKNLAATAHAQKRQRAPFSSFFITKWTKNQDTAKYDLL